jgi:hypothetical protein
MKYLFEKLIFLLKCRAMIVCKHIFLIQTKNDIILGYFWRQMLDVVMAVAPRCQMHGRNFTIRMIGFLIKFLYFGV